MRFIFGLGNPGAKYENTKHNIGFMTLDELARSLNIELNQSNFKSDYGTGHISGNKVFLIKPQTFMNLSGEAVRPFLDYYGGEIEELLVIYDDMDLSPGKVRLRKQGSSGGHNGIKDIIKHLGTQEFKRIKIGIGRPRYEQSVVSHVLNRFSKEDEPQMTHAVKKSVDAVEYWLSGHSFEDTMSHFN